MHESVIALFYNQLKLRLPWEDPLNVSVRLFASYRERVGKAEVNVELPDGATVGHLATEIARRYPRLTPDPKRLVVAVNQEYRDHLHALDDGDEVALIPPVSGGFFAP